MAVALNAAGCLQEKEVEKAQDKLNKWTLALLNSALDLFEIPRGSGEEGRKVGFWSVGWV